MHCYICDDIIPDDKIKISFRTGKIEPCPKCMEIIHGTTDSYEEGVITPFIPDEEADEYLEGDYSEPIPDIADS